MAIDILGAMRGFQGAPAYIDPTAGGVLLQILFGGIAGLALILRLFWHRLVSPFQRWRRSAQGDSPPTDPPATSTR